MEYEPVIGLEVHAQLKTRSKIFCGCPNEFGAAPNEQVCPVCLGMPGVLPVLNRRALEFAIKTGLALNCEIAEFTKFDRKNYFYPDLPKDYQISQYDQPICRRGHLFVSGRKIRIHRAHLEEDAGKLVHAGAAGLHGSQYSLVDFNRCGVPLLEIVSEPDLTGPEEARLYLTELRNILRYLDVCDGDLEKGSFRCDANVSVRPRGETKLGTKTEIKNMNSFRAVKRALESEIERQTGLLKKGERVVQETRLWDEATGTTHPMRSKEEAHDYRYFPEPDLVPLALERSWVETIARTLPELPEARRQRYTEQLGLSKDEAAVLTESKEMSDFFDRVLSLGTPAKAAANWLIGPTIAFLKEKKQDFADTRATPENLRDLILQIEAGVLSSTTAKQVWNAMLRGLQLRLRGGEEKVDFEVTCEDGSETKTITVEVKSLKQQKAALEIYEGLKYFAELREDPPSCNPIFIVSDAAGREVARLQPPGTTMCSLASSVAPYVETHELAQESDEAKLKAEVQRVLAHNPEKLDSYRQGKVKIRQFFFGETMKATGGKANPRVVNKILDELLSQP